ncbi:MAG: hypothetical protein WCB68_09555 [Pyrinomonadaceae bacterium]
MAKGKPGADSTPQVDFQIRGRNIIDLAVDLFGETPLFWGRYFKSLQRASDYEYRRRVESPILHARGIRVLPTAQQTNHVNRDDRDLARADARGNIEDLIKSFDADYMASQGDEFLMFLDVEPTHPLNKNYYASWAETVLSHSSTLSGGRFKVIPAVYLNRTDRRTWRAIAAAAAEEGIVCGGLWVASYGGRPGCTPLPEWDYDAVRPDDIDMPCEVLIWQYTEHCHGPDGFDCNETNPNIDLDNLLRRLVLPSA